MDDRSDSQGLRVAAYVDGLQAHGRYSFTRDEASRALPHSDVALEAALRRLKKRGRLAMPRRGFYVIVPTEYRESGAPPVSWFVDDIMAFLRQPYYVGLLSAAAIHGAAHQQPMAYQVMTDRPTRGLAAGRAQVEFHTSRGIIDVPTDLVQTETGLMRVSTPEAVALDLIRYIAAAGGVSNVATVLDELAERIDADRLAALARTRPAPEVQRLGYLFDVLGEPRLAEAIAASLEGRRLRPVALVPGAPAERVAADARWRVVANEPVEADLRVHYGGSQGVMMATQFDTDAKKLAEFSKRHGVLELAVFGSALRDDFGPESDVDILVTFMSSAKVSLFELVEMADELSGLVGRRVDLVPKQGLKSQIRQSVLESSRIIYAAA
jgi:predicted nucleotidyltransferase/predicted transcriptional regulator of viral defense system